MRAALSTIGWRATTCHLQAGRAEDARGCEGKARMDARYVRAKSARLVRATHAARRPTLVRRAILALATAALATFALAPPALAQVSFGGPTNYPADQAFRSGAGVASAPIDWALVPKR